MPYLSAFGENFFKLSGSNVVINGFLRIGSVKFPADGINRNGICVCALIALRLRKPITASMALMERADIAS